MSIHLVPSFHYDVVYLKSYDEYLELSLKIITRALGILAGDPDYTFTIEQVILLEEYWSRHPEQHGLIRNLAASGRLEIAPGMYVMPDMNMIDGESMFMQARIGREWLRRHLGIEPRSCWIADCWGHHAQLPQILTQAGYDYYFFYRCMRHDVKRNEFLWEGLDGTRIKTHWLATGYANLHFPDAGKVENVLELDLAGITSDDVNRLTSTIHGYGEASAPILICNGGDFCSPQASAPTVVRRLNADGKTEPIEFSTPTRFMNHVDWDHQPVVTGEFNSLFQGSFTSNIRIKQRNHYLGNRLRTLEKLSVLTNASHDYTELWKLLLKQQFHDAICGTIGDRGLADIHCDFDRLEAMIDAGFARLSTPRTEPAWFNPLPFPRRESITAADGRRYQLELPALATAVLPDTAEKEEETTLPTSFANCFYHADIDARGYISSLIPTGADELVNALPCSFGALALQMDYGDLWLNFEGPIDGGCPEAAFTDNVPDPLERERAGIVNRKTFFTSIQSARAVRIGDELIVEQEGTLCFWTINVPFKTTITCSPTAPEIRYRTEFIPRGKHFRIRAAFPTTIANGVSDHEIPYGIQPRDTGEHPAQSWIDHHNDRVGLALFNRGIPANNTDCGCLLLTLFRAAAMEYKTASADSFNEGIPHRFEYAVMPHGPTDFTAIVNRAKCFCHPPEPVAVTVVPDHPDAWRCDRPEIQLDAMRAEGSGVFIRLYEATGREVKNTILTLPRPAKAAAVDRHGGPSQATQAVTNGQMILNFRPFEIKTFLIELDFSAKPII